MNRGNIAGFFSKTTTLIVAVLFIVIGLLFFIKFDPDEYDVLTTGTIVEIDEHYEYVGDDNELVHTVYIDYTVGDTKYEHVDYGSYNHKMKVGDEVELYYMSSDPTQIAGTDKEFVPYIGLAFAVVGVIMLIVPIVKRLRRG